MPHLRRPDKRLPSTQHPKPCQTRKMIFDAMISDYLRLSLQTTTESNIPAIINPPHQVHRSHSPAIEKMEVALQPLPSVPSVPSTFVDMSVPLKEEDASTSSIGRKSSLSQFPSLAAPSPLRKSLRNPRGSSVEPSLTATPGTGLTGNHTSWLAKVREAKALEVTSKRSSVAPARVVTPPGSLKRKSGQFPGSLSDDGDDSEERKAKVPKTSADIFEVAHHLEPRPPVALAPEVPAADVRAAKSADDVTTMQMDLDTDMMAPLKKAIETLRARTGKSLAGNLAEINGQESSPDDLEVVNDALPQLHPLRPSLSAPAPIHKVASVEAIIRTSTPPKSSQANQESTIVPPPREESKRLSVSDLVPKQDMSRASHTSSHKTSISTTPPDSPPVAKKTAFFVPGGPVFNKPPPVFVPPPAVKPEHSPADCVNNVTNATELPGYSLGAPFGLGLQPTKLPKSPPRGPLSAKSTQSSLFSDNVFESQNNVPAWVPRSQDTQITSQESQPVVEKGHPADIDDDDSDSWRIDDKFAETNQMWTPFVGVAAVEDSMTWSTAPSESQIGKKSSLQDPTEDTMDVEGQNHQSQIVDESDEDMDVDDNVLEEGKPTVSLVTVSRVCLCSAPTSDQEMTRRPTLMQQEVNFLWHPPVASHHNPLGFLAMRQNWSVVCSASARRINWNRRRVFS
jgi:hypothetical protein